MRHNYGVKTNRAMPEIALDTLEAFIAAATARSGTPKYMCVFEAFVRGIRDGCFKPGERVPAEAELTARLPVSLGTVQRAMSRLAEHGLVVRNRKTGTFITDRRSQSSEVFVYRFRDQDTGEVLLPFVRVLKVSVDGSPGPWRDALGPGRCVRVDRLVWILNDPPAYTRVYFRHEHGKVLLNVPVEELHGSSTHRMLIEHFHLPSLRKEHRIGVRVLSDIACAQLMLAPGTPGTVWDVQDFSADGRPILFQRLELGPGHRPVEIAEAYKGSTSVGT
jgi:DNA-binding GntR family transcriptional regulator